MSERTWSLEEANRALPDVADAIERARRALERGRDEARTRREHAPTNGHGTLGDPTPDVTAPLEELGARGIVVRDLERGLVDFPARTADGRDYWLCWVVGEPAVEWWHWPEDGFAGRRPVTERPS